MFREIVGDLHNHSTYSDGEYTPEELITHAKERNLSIFALTDHDTLLGLDEAILYGDKIGVKVIPGVEVSLRFNRSFFTGSLHVLLYFSRKQLKDKKFKNTLNTILKQGRGQSLTEIRVEAINKEFGPGGKTPTLKRSLTYEEVSSFGDNISRKHFAMALKEKHGIEEKDKINLLIANSSPAYIPSGIDMTLLQPFIEQNPILTVLAHAAAGSFPGSGHYNEVLPPLECVETLLPEFLDKKILGINGIEVHYPGHIQEHRDILSSWSKKYGLIVTGGSDCHDAKTRPFGVDGMDEAERNSFMEKYLEVAQE